MSSHGRDSGVSDIDTSGRKERKHKHRDRHREGKSRHRTAEAPSEEQAVPQLRKEREKVSSIGCVRAGIASPCCARVKANHWPESCQSWQVHSAYSSNSLRCLRRV